MPSSILPDRRRRSRAASLPLRTSLALVLAAGAARAQSAGFDPPLAADLDPDPDVVEVALRASVSTWRYLPGVDTEVWAYDGSIPGPTIEAEVGDLLRVHFTNDLPEATTIHWHGVETPAAMDGSHISQLTVPPGGSFEYEFPLLRAGLFWYHPHVRPFDQVEKGLYGALLVRDPVADAALGLDACDEHVLVFDDVLLDGLGQVVPAFSFSDPVENALYQLNGRVGNQLLINGKPAGPGLVLGVSNGVPQRWRVLNAANSTFCRLDVNEDSDAQLWAVGSDGGLMAYRQLRPAVVSAYGPSPQFTGGGNGGSGLGGSGTSVAAGAPHPFQANPDEGIFLVPGERMDVVFTPRGSSGQRLRIHQYDWVRGRHIAFVDQDGSVVLLDDPLDGKMPASEVFELRLSGPDPGGADYEPPSRLATLEDLDPQEAVGVLPVTMGHSSPDPAGNVTFFVQAEFSGGAMTPLPAAQVTSEKAFDVEVGQTWIWEVTNLTHGDHPFHTHGFFFQPLDIELFDSLNPQLGRKQTFYRPVWKDTIRVPARPGLKGSSKTVLRALVKFDETGRQGQVEAQGELPTATFGGGWVSGGWLFHCHVLEHSGRGMLSFYELHAAGDPFRLIGKSTPGSLGRPGLTVSGQPVSGASVRFELAQALPGATVYLVIGYGRGDLPLAGGTLVPTPDELYAAKADAKGNAIWSLPYTSMASGTQLWFQTAHVDPGAPGGLAFSNAAEFTAP